MLTVTSGAMRFSGRGGGPGGAVRSTFGTLGATATASARSACPDVMIVDCAVRESSSRVEPASAPVPLKASIEYVTSRSQNCSTTEVIT